MPAGTRLARLDEPVRALARTHIQAHQPTYPNDTGAALSPPKTAREKENAARFQQQGDKKKKHRLEREDDDDDDGGGGGGGGGATVTKMYFKAPQAQRGCPKDAPSYGKGDVWVLWRAEAAVESSEGLGRERPDLVPSLPAARAAFLEAKFQKGALVVALACLDIRCVTGGALTSRHVNSLPLHCKVRFCPAWKCVQRVQIPHIQAHQTPL